MEDAQVPEILGSMDRDLMEFADEMGENVDQLSDESIETFFRRLRRNADHLKKAADGDINASTKVDEQLGARILNALKGLQGNDVLKHRVDNLGNVLLGLWKAIGECEDDLLRLKKRVIIERKDDPGFGSGPK